MAQVSGAGLCALSSPEAEALTYIYDEKRRHKQAALHRWLSGAPLCYTAMVRIRVCRMSGSGRWQVARGGGR